MILYFLLLRIAAFFGHRKAKLLVSGQDKSIRELEQFSQGRPAGETIWFHASSVGEFEQARPIIEQLRAEQPSARILLTFFSPSGYELRKNYDQVDKVVYLPFATRRNARAFLNTVQPKMAIFIKYEFWPTYLKELRKRDIRTYLVSGIFRPTQLFFKPWGKSYRNLLKCFTHLYVQDEESYNLLHKHHIDHVTIAGDTRFDRVAAIARQAKEIPAAKHFTDGQQKVIIAGSTWPEDEELLARYVDSHPDVRLVLVPHEIHAGHLHEIFQLFHGRMVRYTETRMNLLNTCPTLLIDAIGFLSSVYQYGQVAYIGGGFGAGIHNTIEAAVWGMPVLFGPNYQHFREAKGLIAAGAATTISNYEELEAALDHALEAHVEMGRNADTYVKSELGATGKIVESLKFKV